jgi:hypothetical protein
MTINITNSNWNLGKEVSDIVRALMYCRDNNIQLPVLATIVESENMIEELFTDDQIYEGRTTFNLAGLPKLHTLEVRRNSLDQIPGIDNDYVLTANVIVFNLPMTVGETIFVTYSV